MSWHDFSVFPPDPRPRAFFRLPIELLPDLLTGKTRLQEGELPKNFAIVAIEVEQRTGEVFFHITGADVPLRDAGAHSHEFNTVIRAVGP